MKTKTFITPLIFSLALGATCFGETQTINTFETDKFKNTLTRAQAGDPEAQYEIAHEFFNMQKYEDSFTWFEKASQNGNVYATGMLGYLYEHGLGVSENVEKSFYY